MLTITAREDSLDNYDKKWDTFKVTGRCLYGVMAKILGYNLEVSEFKLQSCCFV